MTRAYLVDLQLRGDERGRLVVAEEGKALPFSPRRLFTLFDISPEATRGHHAHREQHQFLIMMSGACTVSAEDETGTARFRLVSPQQALYVPPGIWLELEEFTSGAVCAVLASDVYDEADYIRDRGEFLKTLQAG